MQSTCALDIPVRLSSPLTPFACFPAALAGLTNLTNGVCRNRHLHPVSFYSETEFRFRLELYGISIPFAE
jgi:hypothetical protein